MLNPALNIGNDASRIPLVPAPVERPGSDAELDEEVVAEVLGLGLPALFLPQPNEWDLVSAHDDPCVRAAEEAPPVGVRRSMVDCL